LDAEQRRAAVFRVVKPLFEIGECAAGKQSADLASDSGSQTLLQDMAHQVGDSLGCFQRNIANEAVRDDNVDFAAIEIAPFNVPDEVNRKLFQQIVGFAG